MFDTSNKDFNAFINKCVGILLENNEVAVWSSLGSKKYKSVLMWDPRELIYRYKGELSKGNKCNILHKSICMEIMVRHMRESIGIALLDNGPNSACPIIMSADEIRDPDDHY